MRLAILLLLGACGASPTPMQEINLGFWADNDQICLRNAATRQQFNACADATRAAMCGT